MLYLLLAVGLCLLVPWLHILMARLFPRRPPPPLSAEELRRLAGPARRVQPEAALEVVPIEAGLLCPEVEGPAAEGSLPPKTDNAPIQTPRKATPPSLSLGSYGWLLGIGKVVLIPAFLALGLGWAVLFDYLGEARARSFPPAVFLFKPFSYGIVCAVPGLFLGILSALPMMWLLALLLMGRRRFTNYLFWDEGRMGAGTVDGMMRMMSFLALFVGLGCAAFVLPVMNWYARFTDDEIAIRRFARFWEEVHPYSDVEEVRLTRHPRKDNEVADREDLEVRFKDGRTWDTDQTFVLPRDPAGRERFLEFLARKTGKPIREAIPPADVRGP
jgi:hypothetical protein